MAGFGLLLSGIVCWQRVGPIVPRLRAMLIYNVLAVSYLGYLRFGAESVERLLLPAIGIHSVLAILFIGVCFEHLSTMNHVRKSSIGTEFISLTIFGYVLGAVVIGCIFVLTPQMSPPVIRDNRLTITWI